MISKTGDELIQMVQQLADATLPEDEEDALVEELEKSVPHPRVSDLIYYSDPELTPEEVVDQALAYRPIEL
ncbi:bacteriocin immunity protein [Streptomyces scabichelini]|uniref:bacteriocin immunity protein n=1 Tax=Streptomyces scabichelini TaxID=2711217 RepID=UPI0019D27C1F|nr:bacteriocin immunity protein [Streptomyces scabichelini]